MTRHSFTDIQKEEISKATFLVCRGTTFDYLHFRDGVMKVETVNEAIQIEVTASLRDAVHDWCRSTLSTLVKVSKQGKEIVLLQPLDQ